MSYEPDPGDEEIVTTELLVHRVPKQSIDVSDEDLRKIGLAKGRLKGACEDKPSTLCYGFIFEEDPSGTEIGPAKGPGVEFTDDIDTILPVVIKKLPDRLLIQLLTQYRGLARRADADPWLGTSEQWWSRVKFINLELSSRGVHPYY